MTEILRHIEELPYPQLVVLLALTTLENANESYGWALLDRLTKSKIDVATAFLDLVDRELVWARSESLILQANGHPESLMVDVVKGNITLMSDVDQVLKTKRGAINALYNQKRKKNV